MKTMLIALALVAGTPQARAVDATPTPSAPADAPTAATAEAAPATPAAPEAAVATEKKSCKLERELGSNRAKRVCRTRAEMNADAEAARNSISEAQRGH